MNYELRKILPDHIIHDQPELVDFIEEYLIWLNSEGNPGHVINNMPDYRDIDRAGNEFLEYIQREIAAAIPENIASDRRKLYKNAVDIYLSKGSIPSYQALFNLAFNDKVELSFPRNEILKPSDGKWDAVNQRWKNEDGHLSSSRYIQDSRYYQSFSYVIKTGQTISNWRDSVKKLLHPSGFAFFGQVSIFSEALSGPTANASMKKLQPGRIPKDEYKVPVIVSAVDSKAYAVSLSVEFIVLSSTVNSVGPTWKHVDMQKYYNTDPLSLYTNYSLSDAVAGGKIKISSPSEIIIITTI
jgi:hypothetical protein